MWKSYVMLLFFHIHHYVNCLFCSLTNKVINNNFNGTDFGPIKIIINQLLLPKRKGAGKIARKLIMFMINIIKWEICIISNNIRKWSNLLL